MKGNWNVVRGNQYPISFYERCGTMLSLLSSGWQIGLDRRGNGKNYS